MQQLEYTKELTSAGLLQEESVVYEVLLRIGEQPASKISLEIPSVYPLSRPMVYKVLEELEKKDLVDKISPKSGVATFLAKHPVSIKTELDRKKEEIETIKSQFGIVSGKLSSLFNLSSGRPGVQYFEGKDGVWEVLMDSLTATEEIFSYADLEAISRYIPDLNAEYSAAREDKHIKKRGLVIDSPEARKFLKSYDGNVTTTKLIKHIGDTPNFQTIMQVYDNKVSYITLTDAYLVGIIITDQFIANTHKYLFESMWSSSTGEVV